MVSLFFLSHHTRSSYILKAENDAENKDDDIDIGDNVLSMMLREVATLTLLFQRHHAFFRTTLFPWLSQFRYLSFSVQFITCWICIPQFRRHWDIWTAKKNDSFLYLLIFILFQTSIFSTIDRTAKEGPVRIQQKCLVPIYSNTNNLLVYWKFVQYRSMVYE